MKALTQKERDKKFGAEKRWYCPDCGEQLDDTLDHVLVCPTYLCLNWYKYDPKTGEKIDD